MLPGAQRALHQSWGIREHFSKEVSKPRVFKLGCALESSGKIYKLLMHRLLHRIIKSESLGVRPRHQYFKNSPGGSNVQPKLRTTDLN